MQTFRIMQTNTFKDSNSALNQLKHSCNTAERKVNDIQLFLEKFSLGNDKISMHWRKEEGCIQLFAFVKPNKKTLVIILSYICMVQTGRIEIVNIWVFQIINHILIFCRFILLKYYLYEVLIIYTY